MNRIFSLTSTHIENTQWGIQIRCIVYLFPLLTMGQYFSNTSSLSFCGHSLPDLRSEKAKYIQRNKSGSSSLVGGFYKSKQESKCKNGALPFLAILNLSIKICQLHRVVWTIRICPLHRLFGNCFGSVLFCLVWFLI